MMNTNSLVPNKSTSLQILAAEAPLAERQSVHMEQKPNKQNLLDTEQKLEDRQFPKEKDRI
jgi:hypothetical protein